MKVDSVNIGQQESLVGPNKTFLTGINKFKSAGAVEVDELGLKNDAVCDTRFHGGVDQAVYLYRTEDYDWWSSKLGKDVKPGAFGDNLTVSGLPGPGLMIGDRLRFPNLELQVTAPRIPCATLAAKMQDPDFVKKYLQAQLPGIYFRVTHVGSIAAGDTAELINYEHESLSTVALFNDIRRKLSEPEIESYLALPIDMRSRKDLQDRLDKLKQARL